MSQGGMPGDISLKISKPSLFDFLLKSTHSPSYPFLLMQVKPDSKLEDFSVEVKVSSKLYEYIKTLFFEDQLLLYISFSEREIGFWSADMLKGVRVLSELGIIDKSAKWIENSHAAMTSALTGTKTESRRFNSHAFQLSREMLESLGVLEEVKEIHSLSLIVSDVIARGNMDPDTIVYRLAMSLYHSKFATGKTVVSVIEDPSSAYLKLSETQFFKKQKEAFAVLSDLPIELRTMIFKVIIVFVIAAYVYHNEVQK